MQVTHRLVGASSNDGAEDGNESEGKLHGGDWVLITWLYAFDRQNMLDFRIVSLHQFEIVSNSKLSRS
jgi:hypothetical protein